MAYTVECRTLFEGPARRTIVGQYDDQASAEFWDEMGVDQNAWNTWNAAMSSGRNQILLPDFPELSKLASADEGKIRFSSQALQCLGDECQRAIGSVHSQRVQSLLALLRRGADLALESDGELVVHPFGIPPASVPDLPVAAKTLV